MSLSSFNFKKWIEENRHLLKPPVGNKCMVDGDLIVMVVGGPNARKDYHFDEGAEFFYQVEGDIVVKIIEDGKITRVSKTFFGPGDNFCGVWHFFDMLPQNEEHAE